MPLLDQRKKEKGAFSFLGRKGRKDLTREGEGVRYRGGERKGHSCRKGRGEGILSASLKRQRGKKRFLSFLCSSKRGKKGGGKKKTINRSINRHKKE